MTQPCLLSAGLCCNFTHSTAHPCPVAGPLASYGHTQWHAQHPNDRQARNPRRNSCPRARKTRSSDVLSPRRHRPARTVTPRGLPGLVQWESTHFATFCQCHCPKAAKSSPLTRLPRRSPSRECIAIGLRSTVLTYSRSPPGQLVAACQNARTMDAREISRICLRAPLLPRQDSGLLRRNPTLNLPHAPSSFSCLPSQSVRIFSRQHPVRDRSPPRMPPWAVMLHRLPAPPPPTEFSRFFVIPAQNTQRLCPHFPLAASTLMFRFSTVVVGGMAFSGMSTTVVTPPNAAARVPVQKPSHSVRPGSLRFT